MPYAAPRSPYKEHDMKKFITITLLARILHVALITTPIASFAGSYVDEAKCFGGTVPSTPTGLSSSTTVNSTGGIYMVIAWRQACQTYPDVSVLLLQFKTVSGSPTIGSMYVSQAGLVYEHQSLVKNPAASSEFTICS